MPTPEEQEQLPPDPNGTLPPWNPTGTTIPVGQSPGSGNTAGGAAAVNTARPNPLLDRFPYKNPTPDSNASNTYATPGAYGGPNAVAPNAETEDPADPSSRKPRHLTLYGGLGYNEDGTRRTGDAAAGAAGGGGGGSSSSSSSSSTTGDAPPGFGLDQTILDGIKSLLANGSGYPIDLMKQQLLESTKGQGTANEEALRRDAIRRGVYRSGILSGNIAKNRAAMTADYSRGVTNLLIDKAKADQEAKYKALDAAQRYVDSARDWLLRKESNSIQREVGMAQVRLGYAKIDLERETLAKQGNGGGGGGGNDDDELLQFLLQSGLLGGNTPPPNPFGGN